MAYRNSPLQQLEALQVWLVSTQATVPGPIGDLARRLLGGDGSEDLVAKSDQWEVVLEMWLEADDHFEPAVESPMAAPQEQKILKALSRNFLEGRPIFAAA